MRRLSQRRLRMTDQQGRRRMERMVSWEPKEEGVSRRKEESAVLVVANRLSCRLGTVH